MKQTFLKLAGKKLIVASFLSASVMFISFSANAIAPKAIFEILSGQNTSIKFTGSTTDALLFNVAVKNEKGDNFTITIKDNNDNILFSRSFSEVNFDKNFKLIKGEENGERYTFTITSSNKNLEDTYVISAASHLVDDVLINRL